MGRKARGRGGETERGGRWRWEGRGGGMEGVERGVKIGLSANGDKMSGDVNQFQSGGDHRLRAAGHRFRGSWRCSSAVRGEKMAGA